MAFDFVLEMSEAPGGYSIEVSSPCGEDRTTAAIDAHELLFRLPSLQAAVLGSATRARGVGTELEAPARQVGDMLYDAVFQSSIKALYLSSRQKAQEHGQRLRMVLRVRSPELAALPWELLHDAKLGGYLCLHHPIIRYVEILEPVAPLAVEPPLRILGMVSLPGSLGALDAEAERASLTTALRPLIDEGMVRLEWVPGQTKQDLYAALFRDCHIFHFIGHGRFDADRRQGMIVFADEHGREDPLHAEALGHLISIAEPVPRLVVLNSCETGTSHAQDLFSSTAAELEYTVPAVVAMQFAVTDKAAVLFSRAFYQALAANRPVERGGAHGSHRAAGRQGRQPGMLHARPVPAQWRRPAFRPHLSTTIYSPTDGGRGVQSNSTGNGPRQGVRAARHTIYAVVSSTDHASLQHDALSRYHPEPGHQHRALGGQSGYPSTGTAARHWSPQARAGLGRDHRAADVGASAWRVEHDGERRRLQP
ncbi:hypothetical protein SAFG77S_00139 [Streptomyces afghaniensis]